MSGTIKISVDAMGGDNGSRIVMHGASLALQEHKNIEFLFHGRQEELESLLDEFSDLKPVSTIRHCEKVISMEEKPSQALRKGRNNSSMWFALQAVKDGEAEIAVSGGNTGALMAMATFCFRPMTGISRPAIAAIWPTLRNDIIVLDLGATVGGDAQQLVDFSILGSALARALFNRDEPTIGLLNVGVEEVKGLEPVREAARTLAAARDAGFHYHGFVEGDDIGKGTVDVVVVEGFTGNIVLKTAEGTARQVATYLRNALNANFLSRLGALLASSALNALRSKMDPRKFNGGMFLGLNHIVIKSHGGTDEIGFKSALGLAYEMAHGRLLDKIEDGLSRFSAATENEEKIITTKPEEKPE